MIRTSTTRTSGSSTASWRPTVCALLSVFLCGSLLVACGPSTDVLKLPGASEDLPPVSPSQVEAYRSLSAVKCEYQRVTLLESRESESIDLSDGVSRMGLTRPSRTEAGRLGVNAMVINAMVINTVGSRTSTETEVEADSAGYECIESRESLGRGVFLAGRIDPVSRPRVGRGSAEPKEALVRHRPL